MKAFVIVVMLWSMVKALFIYTRDWETPPKRDPARRARLITGFLIETSIFLYGLMVLL